MNGRCHKDALDRAEDICELCGHQFCAACVLFPRGHRNPPTCKTCALENSGLRGTTKSKNPISKREYKKRKKELLRQLEGIEEEEPAIEYFNLDDPTHFERTTELDRRQHVADEPETIDILGRLEEPAIDGPASTDAHADPAPATPPTPAPTTATPPTATPPRPVPPAAVPPTPVAPTPAAMSGADAGGRTDSTDAVSGLAPVDTSVNPLALDTPSRPAPVTADPEPSEASATAAELLARLKADQPIQSQFTSPPSRPLDTDPFAAPPTDLPTQTPPPHTPTRTPPPHTPTPSSTVDSVTPDSDPFAPAATAAAAPRAKSEPWTPPAPPPRGSNLDAMSGSPAPGTAPTVATPEPTPVATPQVVPAQPTSVAATSAEPTAMPVPHAPQRAAEPAATRSGGADLDESGQWIPPSLRGMATPEERAADPLPKRR